ncbi:MAG: hypothetical protein K2J80_11215, partial [Oscillospiraceae bacterium]|nr:hypothetical protein [Oscillospiraceae bacterium]
MMKSVFKRIARALMCGALASVVVLSGCGNKKYELDSGEPKQIEGFDGNVKDVAPKSGDIIATFEIEDYG